MPDEQPTADQLYERYGIEKDLQFVTEDVPTDNIPFAIDGEQFHVLPWLTGIKFLKYSRMMNEGGLQATVLVDEFFRDVMEPSEYERFTKFLDDPGRRVTTKLLADIFLSLFARYSTGPSAQDRPTSPLRPSSPGRPETEDGSKENSSSEESTPEP